MGVTNAGAQVLTILMGVENDVLGSRLTNPSAGNSNMDGVYKPNELCLVDAREAVLVWDDVLDAAVDGLVGYDRGGAED